jgi:hypothetical protein
MKSASKKLMLLTLAGMLVLIWAGPLFASTVWNNGIVTKAPWTERYQHIEIDKVKYTFMLKNVRLARHFKMPSGAWNESPITLRDIRIGHKVWIRIQGHRIYELFIEEQ